MKKALLFINGEPPKNLPKIESYDVVACTDGAFQYLKDLDFPFEKLNFVSGDFDSYSNKDELLSHEKFIATPDQNKTDFEKALEILLGKNVEKVDVYGGSGKEMDHFLGNLSAAFQFKNRLEIKFFDEFSEYYFIPTHFKIENVNGKMISIFPFPSAENITTKGLNWELNNENLNMLARIGTRNFANEDEVSIQYNSGNLLIFIEK